MKKNIMKSIIKTFAFIACLFAFSSCEVGLGEAVDIEAPVITVNSPERTGYILKTFDIIGKAEDNVEIDRVELSIEPLDNPTAENSYKFRISGLAWEKYDYSSLQWRRYENSASKVNGNKKGFNWNLNVTFPMTVTTGTEFNITTQVFDMFNNESPKSKDERSVTVDMNEPAVTIITPSLSETYSAEANKTYELRDNSIIDNLINGTFTVKGSQKEDGRLSHLFVYLDENTSNTISTDSEKAELKQNAIAYKEVRGDNIRNWSADFNLSTISGYEHERKTVRLVTESHDQAGNVEYNVQGFFTYYNDADIPWIVAEFGGVNSAQKESVYPSSALQGQCYDDDGLKEIIVKVYENGSNTPVDQKIFTTADKLYDKPRYYAWSVNARGEVCDFEVEIVCKDIYNNTSETVKKYLHVTDTNPPAIKITTDTTTPMFGDKDGNVTISGYVEDDGGVVSLKLLRIKENAKPEDIITYYNGGSEWDAVTKTNKTADSNGNKMFWIDLGNADTNDPKNRREFSKQFNIFDAFGINGSTEHLVTQQFIIMATDTGNCNKIDSFSFSGDSQAPYIKIDKLIVYKSDGTEKEEIDFATATSKKLKPYNRNSSTNAITDKIEIQGTWEDDSLNVWDDKTKRGPITLKINDVTKTVTLNTTNPRTEGNRKYYSWTTGKIIPDDSTTAVIDVEFSDYAGNIKKDNNNFFVSSNMPQLLRISSTKEDGSYKAGITIPITLEFNKSVKYTGTGTPKLKLNIIDSDGKNKEIDCTNQKDTLASVYTFNYVIAEKDERINKNTPEEPLQLKVDDIITDNTTWVDEFGASVISMKFSDLGQNNRLDKTRNIKIDTQKPTITSINAISSNGSYNAGKAIFITATFSEDIEVSDTDLGNLTLSLNAATDLTTDTTNNPPKKTGPKTILFTYPVADGQNKDKLKVTGVSFTGITDIAKNAIDTTANSTSEFSGIEIDTIKPVTPVITGITNNDCIYATGGTKFKITKISKDVNKIYYSTDENKRSWIEYTGSKTLQSDDTYSTADISISSNREYKVTARVLDSAGNESEVAANDIIAITIDAGNILTSITAGVPTGTYTTGNAIPIYLNFRKNVKITGGSLTLDDGKTATYTSGTGTQQAVFTYTVNEGDSSDRLNVTKINGTYKDAGNIDVYDYVKTIPDGKNLEDSRTIKIVTGKPVLQSAAFHTTNKDWLILTFSTDIKKGTGDITITHGDGYKAPAVISEEKFINYKAKSSSLTNYYTLGTNGSDVNGNSDLTEKYVLNYATETNNTDLITALKNANADKSIIPVNSSKVIVNGNKLTIKLEESYALPVKGASYTVSFGEGIVKDSQNHRNEADTASINYGGLEAPVVRVNKKRETTGTTVTQPTTTGVKADCQTPGATVTCDVYSQTITKETISTKDTASTKKDLNLTKESTQSTYPFNIGKTDTNNGYIYRIEATAKKTGQTDVTAYEFAYRSVYTLTYVPNGDVGGENDYKQLWVRGSDLPNGGISISSYPVSWDTAQFNKVRAMTQTGTHTQNGNTTTDWVWISWEINKAAHLQPLRGNMPSDDAATKGPSVWCWGMQSYIPGIPKGLTPLYPGHSLAFNAGSNFYFGGMSFYNKHCEYRDNNDKVHKEKK